MAGAALGEDTEAAAEVLAARIGLKQGSKANSDFDQRIEALLSPTATGAAIEAPDSCDRNKIALDKAKAAAAQAEIEQEMAAAALSDADLDRIAEAQIQKQKAAAVQLEDASPTVAVAAADEAARAETDQTAAPSSIPGWSWADHLPKWERTEGCPSAPPSANQLATTTHSSAPPVPCNKSCGMRVAAHGLPSVLGD